MSASYGVVAGLPPAAAETSEAPRTLRKHHSLAAAGILGLRLQEGCRLPADLSWWPVLNLWLGFIGDFGC